MTRLFKVFISLFICVFSYGQELKEIKSCNPSDTNYKDLDLLGVNFNNFKIIGLGEGTHGTSEFTQMRHRIFKYLVQKHNFNTLFLEVDFSLGLIANKYIQNIEGIEQNDVMRSLMYWPSQSNELLELFNWMKSYNENHSNVLLQIIGTEGQNFSETFKIFIQELKNKEIDYKFDSLFYSKQNNTELFNNMEKMELFYSELEASCFDYFSKFNNDNDSINLILLRNNIFQSIIKRTAEPTKKNYYRNIHIAENMLFQISNKPNLKALYIAHNGHITKEKYYYHNGAGYYLRKSLGKKYFSIAQVIEDGKFLALKKVNDTLPYQVKIYDYQNTNNKSLTYKYKDYYSHYGFVLVKNIKKRKKMELMFVGAILNSLEDLGYEKGVQCYDAIILIKNSNPLDLCFVNKKLILK